MTAPVIPARASGPPAATAQADRPLVEVRGLVKHFPIRGGILQRALGVVQAVDGVDFTIRRGETLGLVGESGCGKTTTAHAVMRMLVPRSGSVEISGRDIAPLSERALRPLRREAQIVFQDPYESLDPRYRVRDTVAEPLVIHDIGSREDRTERVRLALEHAGLSPAELFLDRYPHELSGGQRQRVAIASALVLEPRLLVADEPVSMLDVSVRAGILDLLDDLRRSGLGILMITHDLSTAAHYADRILVMYLGRIVEEGPARSIVDDPQHPYTRALISVVPRRYPHDRHRPQILQGETPNPVDIPEGCRFHPRCPIGDESCRAVDPQLEPEAGHRAACIKL
jgi:oligopeptide/dipeptide ABC transporter ATP-binding protein